MFLDPAGNVEHVCYLDSLFIQKTTCFKYFALHESKTQDHSHGLHKVTTPKQDVQTSRRQNHILCSHCVSVQRDHLPKGCVLFLSPFPNPEQTPSKTKPNQTKKKYNITTLRPWLYSSLDFFLTNKLSSVRWDSVVQASSNGRCLGLVFGSPGGDSDVGCGKQHCLVVIWLWVKTLSGTFLG